MNVIPRRVLQRRKELDAVQIGAISGPFARRSDVSFRHTFDDE